MAQPDPSRHVLSKVEKLKNGKLKSIRVQAVGIGLRAKGVKEYAEAREVRILPLVAVRNQLLTLFRGISVADSQAASGA